MLNLQKVTGKVNVLGFFPYDKVVQYFKQTAMKIPQSYLHFKKWHAKNYLCVTDLGFGPWNNLF